MPIPEVSKIWMNGELVDWHEAKVHILTHALHYGSGVFEGIRAYEANGGAAVFRLTPHIERLFRSAKIYFMEPPYSVAEVIQATKDVIKANELKSCYIRPIMYRGYGEMGLYPLKCPVDMSIAVWPWGAYLGEDGIKHGIRSMVSSFRRIDLNALPPAAKATGQYINSILAKVEAVQAGFDEAVLLDARGMVSEGSGENIFIVKDETLFTPSLSSSVLDGITKDSVMQIADLLEIEVRECDLVRTDLYLADEAFYTGTAAEIVPIREVDNRLIGEPGPVTKAIQDVFYGILKGEDDRFAHWLEYVDE